MSRFKSVNKRTGELLPHEHLRQGAESPAFFKSEKGSVHDMQKKFQAGTFMPDSMISCRTLYKANGFSDDDFSRPVIGICDSFTDIVPGHKNLRELSEQVKYGVYRAADPAIPCPPGRSWPTALKSWPGPTGWMVSCWWVPATRPCPEC